MHTHHSPFTRRGDERKFRMRNILLLLSVFRSRNTQLHTCTRAHTLTHALAWTLDSFNECKWFLGQTVQTESDYGEDVA